MEGFAEHKVQNGKLVCVNVVYEDKIESLKITGDFFMHPEEALQEIERSIKGIDANSNEESITRIVQKVASEKRVEMIGITPEAIAKTIRMAIK